MSKTGIEPRPAHSGRTEVVLEWSEWIPTQKFLLDVEVLAGKSGLYRVRDAEFKKILMVGRSPLNGHSKAGLAGCAPRNFCARNGKGRTFDRKNTEVCWTFLFPTEVRKALLQERRRLVLADINFGAWSGWHDLFPSTSRLPQFLVGVYVFQERTEVAPHYVGKSDRCLRHRAIRHFNLRNTKSRPDRFRRYTHEFYADPRRRDKFEMGWIPVAPHPASPEELLLVANLEALLIQALSPPANLARLGENDQLPLPFGDLSQVEKLAQPILDEVYTVAARQVDPEIPF